MAKLLSGILGRLSGKVAGLVGAQWKNVNYIREYVKPANPNTALQQAQRTKMSDVVAFCKPLVGPVFNAYTDRFYKAMSGFNAFIRSNIAIFDGSPVYSSIYLTEGKLSNILIASSTYDTGGPDITISYLANLGNNGANDDAVYAACYHVPTGFWYFPAAETARNSSDIVITVPAGLTPTDFECYAWAIRYTNTLVSLISYSFHDQSTAP